jgi:2-dehydro-3-deoxyphosphooctonate aldolase (KDO 8-P synthase)
VPTNVDHLWTELTDRRRLFLIAGPCVIESEKLCLEIAEVLRQVCSELNVTCVFKASYDKANRSSGSSFRGPGLESGLKVLERVRKELGVPVLTDVHAVEEVPAAAQVCDVLQIPALLCRQTDLVQAAARSGKIVNLKKGQFVAPLDMKHVVQKAVAAGATQVLVTERGASFGYNNLVADMRAMPILRQSGFPVVFDATHSVQLPGAGGDRSGGQREFAPVLARAAIAAGADGLFVETHPEPERALSDGPNMIPLAELGAHLRVWLRVHEAVAGTDS